MGIVPQTRTVFGCTAVAALISFSSPLLAIQLPPAPLDADITGATANGTAYTTPKAWVRTISGSLIVLEAPEGDSRIAIIGVPRASDAAAAAASAWHLYRPGSKRAVNLVTPRPAKNGWDEHVVIDYETSPNERSTVQAIALRKGADWTVEILDGTRSTFDKRYAAVDLATRSLRPAGYVRESFAGRKAHRLDSVRVEKLRVFVEESARALGVPGVGLAIIDHGVVVYEGGVGVRELGKPQRVDAHTQFAIASNTKSMTTLLLGKLVDEGKLRWDQPVVEVFPTFRLGDQETARKIQVRHLVCACTGLSNQDYESMFTGDARTPASRTFDLLASSTPTTDFGTIFQYNNLLAGAAGYVGAHVLFPKRELGAAYDAAMQAKIFRPLGMRETLLSAKSAFAGNHASPHGYDIEGVQRVASMDFNNSISSSSPAGGV